MLFKAFRLMLPLLTVCTLPMAAAAVEPVPAESFDKLHALIKPEDAEDKWTQIPWRTNLWDARIEAARQGKPILLWEMDGHPLGCT